MQRHTKYGKVCPQYHISLQRDDETLKDEQKVYDTRLQTICYVFKKKIKDVAITTDDGGFSGETDQEFYETQVLEQIMFVYTCF